MSTKIPAQLRITLKEQFDYTYDVTHGTHTKKAGNPLGFANVYAPDTKAYAARAATQDAWAYNSHRYDANDNVWLTGRRWGGSNMIDVDTIVPPELQPIIIDNVPLDGFLIQESVSRCSTSNKLWRILDPRGFELEITTGTMENLIMSGTIENGLIVGACIWKTAKILARV